MEEKNKGKFIEKIKLILIGFCSGIVNGFFGAGGGLVIVPALTFFTKNDTKKIHATTLAIVMVMCALSSTCYFIKKVFDFKLIFPCTIGGILGGILGTFLLKKLKNKVIDLIFDFVLIVAGILMIIF